jgi:hypothetical protein
VAVAVGGSGVAVMVTVAVGDGAAETTVAVPDAALTDASMAVRPLATINAARPKDTARVPRMHCARKIRCSWSTMHEERIDIQSPKARVAYYLLLKQE